MKKKAKIGCFTSPGKKNLKINLPLPEIKKDNAAMNLSAVKIAAQKTIFHTQ
jgi:hypothetical protein